jgi:predicted ATPase
VGVEAIIRALTLKRFRSIPAERVEFQNPTFLVGRNGSGKSNLVDAFSFLSEAMTSPLQAVFDKRGGISIVRNRTSVRSAPPDLGLAVEFGKINGEIERGRYAFQIKALPNYGFRVVKEQCIVAAASGEISRFDRSREGFRSNVLEPGPSLDPASLALPVVGGEARFAPILRTLLSMRVYSIEPSKIRDMQDPDSGMSLRSDGGNAASVLQEIDRRSKGDFERICQLLQSIVPHTTRVRTSKHGKKLSLTFTQEWGDRKRLRFEAFSMSDGTLRALGLLTAVFQKPTPALMVIEEPGSTIHPGALGAVLDLLKHATTRMQVIVTTHSPDVLDAPWIEHKHLRMVTWEEGATHIGAVADSSRKALQQHLMGAGELLRSNALEAAPLFTEGEYRQQRLFEDGLENSAGR